MNRKNPSTTLCSVIAYFPSMLSGMETHLHSSRLVVVGIQLVMREEKKHHLVRCYRAEQT